MKNVFEAIDCQISAILGRVVHGGYTLDLLRNVQREFLAAHWALDKEIKKREGACTVPIRNDAPARGLLDYIMHPEQGGAA